MTNQATAIQKFLLKNITRHPHDIVTVAAHHFQVTKTTIHRHINHLLKKQKIFKTGTTRNSRYYIVGEKNKQLVFKKLSNLDEASIWNKHFNKDLTELPKNIQDICYYGFTEIFNNAIEHAFCNTILVSTIWQTNTITIHIQDDGIGIFIKLKKALKLMDERESLLHLTKGKVTTDPQNHTGEGLFFTARIFDIFTIQANGLLYCRDNILQDWFVESIHNKNRGTKVSIQIRKNALQTLTDVFNQYTNLETYEFDKTDIIVQLAKLGTETYMSRSQAKRILFGLDKFKYITLDFKGVRIIGQAFVDEVFRVFQNKYPDIKLAYQHANKDVEFMIKRSLS